MRSCLRDGKKKKQREKEEAKEEEEGEGRREGENKREPRPQSQTWLQVADYGLQRVQTVSAWDEWSHKIILVMMIVRDDGGFVSLVAVVVVVSSKIVAGDAYEPGPCFGQQHHPRVGLIRY